MSFLVILGVFAALYGLWFVLARNPEWPVSKFALRWRGPVPIKGETYVHFLFRWALFSANFSFSFAMIFMIGLLLDIPSEGAPLWVSGVFAMALPLGFAASVVACISFVLRALWNLLFKESKVFEASQDDFC